jgi:hypothetical protein
MKVKLWMECSMFGDCSLMKLKALAWQDALWKAAYKRDLRERLHDEAAWKS